MVKIYTIDRCPYCQELKNLLTSANIEFTEVNVDIEENKKEYDRIHKITKSDEVPIIKINSKLLVPNVSFHSINDAFYLIKTIIIEDNK